MSYLFPQIKQNKKNRQANKKWAAISVQMPPVPDVAFLGYLFTSSWFNGSKLTVSNRTGV